MAFPKTTERKPVALCKKLRRIENSLAPTLCGYCNGTHTLETVDKMTEGALIRVCKLLGLTQSDAIACGLFVNRDPRGYALKLDYAWVRGYNGTQYKAGGLPIYTDWGGYGIIAPDLTVEERQVAA